MTSPEKLTQLVRRDDRLRGQVEGSAGVAGQRQPVGARHVLEMKRLELQARDAWDERDEARASKRARQ